ncbi:MAG TPA: hypothetical protein VHB54_13890, partial [Mucilaginibacter sp.]|nr:hypothetical protein [Mucilaginibacter sp.]
MTTEQIEELQLRNARLEADLIRKNREIEIEGALEKVRSRAMAMKNSGELAELVRAVFKELTKLDFALTRCIINILEEETYSGRWWMANIEDDKTPASYFIKYKELSYFKSAFKAWKERDTKWEYALKGQEKLILDDYLFSETELKTLPPEVQAGMRSSESLVISAAYGNFGCVHVASLEPLSDENREILARFGQVFDLTYTRFSDLKQAEEQVRESRIQLALERVRARTMAMHTSDELAETAAVLFSQLTKLGDGPARISIGIPDEAAGTVNFWATDQEGGQINVNFKARLSEQTTLSKMFAAWKAEAKSVSIDLRGEELEEWVRFCREEMKIIIRDDLLKDRRTHTVACFPAGWINYTTHEPPSRDAIRVLERFADMFGYTYTRFLDLQKAEAQARESQIQLALERVRARTMAMQKSEELADCASLMFEQVQSLGIPSWSCGYNVWSKGARTATCWMSNKGLLQPPFEVPLTEHATFIKFRESREKGEDFWFEELGGDELKAHYQYIISLPDIEKVTSLNEQRGVSLPDFQINHIANFSHGNLLFITYERVPEAKKIFTRFAKVFEQTYTRFLDLQKAEAQAREAQIELSLERVRASAMAMHKTDQLLDAAELLYRELTGLGIKSMAVTYSIMATDEKSAAYYSINPVDGKLNPVPFDLPHTETEVMRVILSGWKKQEAFSKLVLDEEATLKHQTYIAGKVQAHFAAHNFDHPFSVEAFLEVSPKKAVIYAFNFAQGYIFIIGSEHLTKSQEEMVMRFTKAFEMTYRRFLDLKQAEEQAREAQIEAALERVRSKSLAMYHTSEIQLVIHTVHEELLKLNISIFGGSFIAINKDITDKLYVWGSGGTADTATEILVPDFNMTFCTNLINGIKQGRGFFTEEFSRQEKIEYFTELFKHEPWSAIPLEEQKAVLEGEGNYTRSVAVSNYTSIFIVNHNGRKFTDDENDILKRFSKVFEQSYTRFLDLQNAEEQARESQIQLALERVRARTMAMQHSEELVEVIQLVFDQLQQLNFDIDVANFALNYKETDDLDLLLAVPHGKYPMKIHVPYIQHPVFDRFNQAKKKEGLLVDALSKEEKDSFFEHFFKYVPGVPEENKSSIFSRPGFVRSSALMKNTALTIHNYDGIPYSEAENNILMRFGQVFDQTYTRFNDLKQAEDQAREAQIQLALERVRARTMAMQKSEELAETVFILFQQFKELGENPDQATIGIINEKEHVIEYWVTMYGSQTNKVYKFSIDEPNVTRKIYDAWKHKKTSLVIDLSGKELHDFASYRERMGGARLNKGEKRRIINVAFFSKGLINVQSTEERSEESLKLLERFAAVFEGTYTRFLDLQQAEAQALESQIQLGLERVRAAAMAMHNSQDVGNATALMFSELYKLGITTIRCGICIIDNTAQQMEVWSANSSADGKVNRGAGRLDMNAHPLWLYLLDAWRQKKSSFSYKLAGKELADYYKVIKNAPNYDAQKNIQRDDAPGANQYCNCFLFNEGCLFTFTDAPFSPEISRVLEKFAAVFGLTYRRYLDLTRAEAQAREAQIEAALERVRSKTMAMHNSAGVGETVTLMFNELIRLGIDRMARCGIAIPDDNRIIELWTAKLSKDEKEEIIIGHIDTAIHPMLGLLYETWKNKQPAFEYILEGDDLVNYMTALNNSTGYPIKYDMKSWGGKQHHNDFFFAEGMVFAVTSQPLSVEAAAIFKRFAGVFGQTYRRYLDLKRA